ncbi:DNA polymerase III subunit gamma/tau [Cohnella cholangitidis]|uniref:DNA-directed DNA polymerase n=1 Tax=Cohnella cholangitidis TaxID=2598458 RepID=A0A7G5C048_9BACL|nr:DNA polymerase III subunit gamma/tau [Cohnella cholangitidis]QMV42582.1 DNA polymerase III subunit gamma/tau [Cohnella cholangitidis]
MAHLALYRAWRPQTFKDMVGQQHIVQTLQNAIRENRLSHAYLFSGPRGTGKTSAAKILAKAVNCEHGPAPEPCNECSQCERITSGSVMDVVEIDAASNRGVEEIRDIRDKVKYSPTEVRRKVYIIDEVHMLTTEAFNALLKTLEEPPGHVMFVLATTEPHKLPPTIISRCQRFDFRRVSLEEQAGRLREICAEEQITAEEEALRYIARLSDGGMRDALSLLDQISSFTGGQVSLDQAIEATGGLPSEQFSRLAIAVRDNDATKVLLEIDEMMRSGKSADKCLEQLMYYFRDLLLTQLAPDAGESSGRIASPSELKEMSDGFSRERLFAIIDLLNRYQSEMKYAAHPQTMFEIALLKLCSEHPGASSATSAATQADAGVGRGELGQLKQQIAALEKRLGALASGGAVSATAASPSSGQGGGGNRGASGGSAPSNSPRPSSVPRSKLNAFVEAHAASGQSLAKWPQILQRVKEERVTVHAWLVDGEPVSFDDHALLVAFRNTIHRETTERPANKGVIESVLSSLYGQPTQLVTVMQKEWQEVVAESSGQSKGNAAGEELLLVPEDEAEGKSEPWVDEAVRLFGEQLVTIKDD